MAGYIGSKSSVTQVDGYTEAEADAEFVNDPNGAITVDGSNVGIGTTPVDRFSVSHSDGTGANIGIQVHNTDTSTASNFAGIYSTAVNGTVGMRLQAASHAGVTAATFGTTTNHLARFVTGDTERMRIDTSGRVTMPYQPAFLVTKSGDQTNLSVGYNDITWQNEVYDIGSNFASNTFTAPVTGKYLLTANISLKSQPKNAAWYILRIATSNRNYMNSQSTGHWDTNASDYLKTLASTVVVDMDANDTASLMYYQYTGTAQADIAVDTIYTFFSGILLS